MGSKIKERAAKETLKNLTKKMDEVRNKIE
jgi:hypothetical protein